MVLVISTETTGCLAILDSQLAALAAALIDSGVEPCNLLARMGMERPRPCWNHDRLRLLGENRQAPRDGAAA